MDSTEHQDPQSTTRIELIRPPYWSSGMIMFAVAVGWFGASAIQMVVVAAAGEQAELTVAIGVLLSLLALSVVVFGGRLWTRRYAMPAMVFHADRVELPGSVEARFSRPVPYSEILSVGIVGPAARASVLVETRSRLFVLPFSLFVDEESAHRSVVEITRRIVALPEGQATLRAAARKQELAERVLLTRPIVMQALLGILIVVYLNQLLSGGDDPLGVIRWGAIVPVLIREGEYFRLIAASFLHHQIDGLPLHILVNGFALYMLGRVMEPILSSARFLVLYLGSGLAASVATLAVGSGPSVGASGAVFGLIGGLAFINWYYRTDLPLGFRQTPRWWATIIGLNVGLVLFFQVLPIGIRIDAAAHAGGFVAGAAITAAFLWGKDVSHFGSPSGTMAKSVAIMLSIMVLWYLGQAALYASEFDDKHRDKVAVTLLGDPSLDPVQLNNYAWALALHSRTSNATLARAEDAARRAVEGEPEETAFRDTLATIYFRNGKFDEAVIEELAVVATRRDLEMMSQLARFAAARFDRDGPLSLNGANIEGVSVALGARDETGEPRELVLSVGDSRFPEGATVVAVLRRGGKHVGVLFAQLGPNPAAKSTFPINGVISVSLAGNRVRFDLVVVDAAPTNVAAGEVDGKLWGHDERVNDYGAPPEFVPTYRQQVEGADAGATEDGAIEDGAIEDGANEDSVLEETSASEDGILAMPAELRERVLAYESKTVGPLSDEAVCTAVNEAMSLSKSLGDHFFDRRDALFETEGDDYELFVDGVRSLSQRLRGIMLAVGGETFYADVQLKELEPLGGVSAAKLLDAASPFIVGDAVWQRRTSGVTACADLQQAKEPLERLRDGWTAAPPCLQSALIEPLTASLKQMSEWTVYCVTKSEARAAAVAVEPLLNDLVELDGPSAAASAVRSVNSDDARFSVVND